MSKKLLPNRISKTPAPDALAKITGAIMLIMVLLGDDTDISDDDYKALRKIADKLKRECDDVFDVAKVNESFVETPLTIEEIQKDKAYYEFCEAIRPFLNALMIKFEREQNVAGAEYYNACVVFEADVDAKVKRGNNPKAQNVQTQLAGIERNRNNGATKKDDKGDKGDKGDKPTS